MKPPRSRHEATMKPHVTAKARQPRYLSPSPSSLPGLRAMKPPRSRHEATMKLYVAAKARQPYYLSPSPSSPPGLKAMKPHAAGASCAVPGSDDAAMSDRKPKPKSGSGALSASIASSACGVWGEVCGRCENVRGKKEVGVAHDGC
eukprot:364428-Chlamydomonas_euryale.AAC.3